MLAFRRFTSVWGGTLWSRAWRRGGSGAPASRPLRLLAGARTPAHKLHPPRASRYPSARALPASRDEARVHPHAIPLRIRSPS
jgi:hypothetical protein